MVLEEGPNYPLEEEEEEKAYHHRPLARHRGALEGVVELLSYYTSFPMIRRKKHRPPTLRRHCFEGLYFLQLFDFLLYYCALLDLLFFLSDIPRLLRISIPATCRD